MRTTWVPAPRHPSLLLRGYSQWPTGWPLGSELTHAEEIHQIAVMLPTPAMCDGHPIKPSLWADPLVGPQRCEAAAPSRSGWTFRLTGPPTGGSVQSDAGCPRVVPGSVVSRGNPSSPAAAAPGSGRMGNPTSWQGVLPVAGTRLQCTDTQPLPAAHFQFVANKWESAGSSPRASALKIRVWGYQ